MLSVSKGMSSGDASSYHSKEDYYLKGTEGQEATRWVGEGAEALGLTGPVNKDDFRAMCEGVDPKTGEQIVNAKSGTEERRAGNDLTFSAPKSVSVAYAAGGEGAKQIKAAHDAAVLAVAKHIEQHNTHFKSSGEMVNGTLVAAKFDHATSRELDTQLHSHLFVVNATQDKEGKWHANDPKTIFQDQKALGKLYRQELAHELKERGFDVGFEQGKADARSQMYIELKNVDPALTNHFSSRREQIEAQVKEWQKEGQFKNVPHAKLYEMAALETRDAKREVSKEDVEKSWSKGFETCGTTRDQVATQIEADRQERLQAREQGAELHQGDQVKDQAANFKDQAKGPEGQGREGEPRRDPDAAPSKETAAEGVMKEIEGRPQDYTAAEIVKLVAAHMTETEAVMDRKHLLDQAVQVSGGNHRIEDLNKAIDGGAPGVERMGQGARSGREFYTTAEMRELEARNLQTVAGLAGTFQSCTTREEVGAFLQKLEKEEGIRLTAGQRDLVTNELAGKNGVQANQGDPGTGKTFASQIVERFNSEVLKPSGRDHYTINIAYTGKAAIEMSEASGRPSRTIDSFLNAAAAGKIQILGEGQKLSAADEKKGIIGIPHNAQVALKVDEVSFLGAKQAEHLLNVVKDLQAQGVEAKISLTGDTKQLQAIQSGDLLRQVQKLGESGLVDTATMKEINRQKDEGLLKIATNLNRDGDKATLAENAKGALDALHQRGSVYQEADRAKLIELATDRYMQASNKLSNVQAKADQGVKQSVLMVTATNSDRHELNASIREARIKAGEIQRGESFNIQTPTKAGVTADAYKEGQTIVFSGSRGKDGKMHAWGAKLNQEGIVTGRNLEKNTVTVKYTTQVKDEQGRLVDKTITKDLKAGEMSGKTTAYENATRNFAVGDRIVALKNDKELGVQNGSLLEIKDIQGTLAKVAFGEGKGAKEATIDLSKYQFVDHAYTVTTHKSQGATVEKSIMFSYVKPELQQKAEQQQGKTPPPWVEQAQQQFGQSSYNQLNVAVTRAQYDAEIITNNLDGLKKAVESVTEKTSTITPGREGEVARSAQREKDQEPGKEREPNQFTAQQREQREREAQERVLGPKDRFASYEEKRTVGNNQAGTSLHYNRGHVDVETVRKQTLFSGGTLTNRTRTHAEGITKTATTRHGGSYTEKGTVNRWDGTKAKYDKTGFKMVGYSKSRTIEKAGDCVKITKSSKLGFGNRKGTITHIYANGRITEQTFEVKQRMFGKDEFIPGKTTVEHNQKLADKYHLSSWQKFVKFCYGLTHGKEERGQGRGPEQQNPTHREFFDQHARFAANDAQKDLKDSIAKGEGHRNAGHEISGDHNGPKDPKDPKGPTPPPTPEVTAAEKADLKASLEKIVAEIQREGGTTGRENMDRITDALSKLENSGKGADHRSPGGEAISKSLGELANTMREAREGAKNALESFQHEKGKGPSGEGHERGESHSQGQQGRDHGGMER